MNMSIPETIGCARHLEQRYNSARTDKYDPALITEKKIEIIFYGVSRADGIFGGLKYGSFGANQWVSERGREVDVRTVTETFFRAQRQ